MAENSNLHSFQLSAYIHIYILNTFKVVIAIQLSGLNSVGPPSVKSGGYNGYNSFLAKKLMILC